MSENSQSFVLESPFTIHLKMLSDWHVSTGAGIPGSVDALLAKDGEGFPQVPAKTIVGIWRDAMETLTFGLDNGGQQNVWQKWVEVIFGIQPNQIKKDDLAERIKNKEMTYSNSILTLQPARIDKDLRDTINSFSEADQTKYKRALTFTKPEIKIDEVSGTSETDMLRFAEMGRIGTVLEAECKSDFEILDNVSDSQKQIISALLIASAKLVERIGGKRRRGSGKCDLKIDGKQISKEITDFLGTVEASKIPSLKEESNEYEFASPENDENWQKLEYTLTLQTPVSIVTATLGNVSESLDFIPGTYLLPHITKKLGKDIFKYIANGDLQISPATIEVNGKRGLPVPKVISAHKVEGGFDKPKTIYNKFRDATDKNTPQLKPFRNGYLQDLKSVENGKDKLPPYKNASITLLMHNTVEDDYQRPTSDVGGVYSRQAIAAGTILRGEIRFKKSLNLDFSNASGEVRLGTSKKDDYGLADFEVLGEPDSTNPEMKDKELIVYLESDVLLRNGNLRQTNLTCDLKKELEKTFGEESLECTRGSLIQTRRIESWNVGWGFPRPTLIAMAAGSCVKFQAVTEIESNDLQKLENEGIGERRGEGYGRIRFNLKILTEKINNWERAEKPRDYIQTNIANEADKKFDSTDERLINFAEQIEATSWREELNRAVLQIADKPEKRRAIFGFIKGGKPSMSQIGSLRSVIMRLKDDGSNKQIVLDWLSHLKKTKNRLEKWDGFGEIENLFNNGNESLVWQKLEWNEPPTLLNDSKVKEKLWAEAARALFDACMRAHKREGGES